jgi:hypothetical protein
MQTLADQTMRPPGRKIKAFGIHTVFVCLFFVLTLVYFGSVMGYANLFSTLMKTSHNLLLNTVFLITAISVLAGAFSSILAEFGVLALLNWALAPIVRLGWGLPGAATLGALSTYISDNPAIITLAKDRGFIAYFKEYQRPALTNFGTSFGMGLILTAFMISLGFFREALIGNLGAIIGSIVSTRLMIFFARRELPPQPQEQDNEKDFLDFRYIRDGNLFQRILDAALEGGKNGLEMGMQIVPGVLVICTLILMLTFGPGEHGYTGAAYEGIPLLSQAGNYLSAPLDILFGFQNSDALAFLITSLGAVGAAMSMVPKFIAEGIVGSNEIAVFTAMGMCWSGYLSTHIAMMDALGYRRLTGKAILSHTIGGLLAGVSAHQMYVAAVMLGWV